MDGAAPDTSSGNTSASDGGAGTDTSPKGPDASGPADLGAVSPVWDAADQASADVPPSAQVDTPLPSPDAPADLLPGATDMLLADVLPSPQFDVALPSPDSIPDSLPDLVPDALPDSSPDLPLIDADVAPPTPDSRDAEPQGDVARAYNESAGIFVVASAPANSNCGDRGIPCQTITQGIARAKATGRNIVYVGAGTYTESVSLAAGIRVEGDWNVLGSTWTPIYTNPGDAVIIQGTTDKAVIAKDLGGAAALALATVKSKPTAGPNESLYGVFATGTTTTVSLENVKVLVANGGNGDRGAGGGQGTDGSDQGCGSAAGNGANGADGGNGVPGPKATFGASGCVQGSGAAGEKGGNGSNGTPGKPAGAAVTDCKRCSSSNASSCSSAESSVGQPGQAGCAGTAGIGAGGGKGGGSSIALYSWGATVNVQGGILQAGNGGEGGDGGKGGLGGKGKPGVAGNGSTPQCFNCYTTSQWEGSPSELVYYCHTTLKGQSSNGDAGGAGGDGGDGGHGGAGAGGSSFGILSGGQAVVTTSTSMPTDIRHGTPGEGGVSPAGIAGLRGDSGNTGPS